MVFFDEIIQRIKDERPDAKGLAREKIKLCCHLKKIPSNFDILLHASQEDLRIIKPFLKTKPTRTLSGVAIVAIMAKPRACPHGKCLMCPGGPNSAFGNVPQSYTGKEPATRRAIRNHFDPYLQVFNRLEQYTVLGHPIEKVELIIMGGTFPAYPKPYQESFVTMAFKAMNDFSRMFISKGEIDIEAFRGFFELPGDIKSNARVNRIHTKILALKGKSALEGEQRRNETSGVRCVAMCIETRPDYCMEKHIKQMLRLGCTRVELGVQSLDNKVLEKIERGHNVEDTINATMLLRKALIKVGYHIMIGLPGSSPKQDVEAFKVLFSDPRFQPDFLKIYPCLVVRGTRLFKLWKQGKYSPLSAEQAAEIIVKAKGFIPEYTRIMRVQRDIPEQELAAGPKLSNLRQLVQSKNPVCRCIRCREYGTKTKLGTVVNPLMQRYRTLHYKASGDEYFIQCENAKTDTLLGFCRLRVEGSIAGIRELHVYGEMVKIGKGGDVQHSGIGKELMRQAEAIAKKNSARELKVISGVGARGYYRKLGFRRQGSYMVKRI